MKQFEIPEIEIIRFETEEILTDSARDDELKILPVGTTSMTGDQ